MDEGLVILDRIVVYPENCRRGINHNRKSSKDCAQVQP